MLIGWCQRSFRCFHTSLLPFFHSVLCSFSFSLFGLLSKMSPAPSKNELKSRFSQSWIQKWGFPKVAFNLGKWPSKMFGECSEIYVIPNKLKKIFPKVFPKVGVLKTLYVTAKRKYPLWGKFSHSLTISPFLPIFPNTFPSYSSQIIIRREGFLEDFFSLSSHFFLG